MNLPKNFLPSIANAPGFEESAFVDVHEKGKQVTSVRLNPSKETKQLSLPFDRRIPWASSGYYLSERPSFTFDPFFHSGCYYVQEASSMFLEQALKQTTELSRDLRILDLCAAPGGKSTHLQSLISSGSLLVSNEVIRSRGNILRDNMIRWGSANVVVTHNDPAQFEALDNYFDVIVIDAPCSGSGLFRKDPAAIGEWSPENVQLCSQRQQRILADAWPALKPGGLLVYATCSYSVAEDEKIARWIETSLEGIYLSLDIPGDWGIIPTDPGYRFWPYRLDGEGFFLAVFKKPGKAAERVSTKSKRINQVTTKEAQELKNRVRGDFTFLRNGDDVYAWPDELVNDFAFLLDKLRISYSGIHMGSFARDKFLPSHALALSVHAHPGLPRWELGREQAIRYLQRKEIEGMPGEKGWQLVSFGEMSLGWVNVLPNRINNYYPRELRILRDF